MKKWALITIGILLALLVLKAVLFLTAKPEITVDYLAKYNRITRPENYDPNENAAPYYQKAFDVFVEMPDELGSGYNNWPTDYIDAEQEMLERWIASNSQAFEFFKIAANKPYYWLERHAKRNDMFSIKFPEMFLLHHLTEALLWNAKLTTYKDQSPTVLNNIIECYRAGCQKCRTPSSVVEQLLGMRLKRNAIDSALIIMDKTQFDISVLESFQATLQSEVDNDTYVPNFTAEKLFLYNGLQISFTENGRGTGRLAWGSSKDITLYSGFFDYFTKRLYYCLMGPTKNQIVEQIEQTSVLFNQVMAKTPWQLKNESRDYSIEIRKAQKQSFSLEILDIGFTDSYRVSNDFYKTKAETEALIAVLAILRFEADNRRCPKSLEELVSTGYLKSIPMDPYSDGPLVYKATEDNFTLYSVGEDFSDDGGSYEIKAGLGGVPLGGYIRPSKHPPDIVYWPYKDLMKLLNEHLIKIGKVRGKTARKLLSLRKENAGADEINQLKEEWWEELESVFAKYPEQYPNVDKVRRFKEDWWGIIEKDAKQLLEKTDQNQLQ